MAMKGVLQSPIALNVSTKGRMTVKGGSSMQPQLNHAIQPPFSVLTMPFTIMILSCFGNWLYHGLCWS